MKYKLSAIFLVLFLIVGCIITEMYYKKDLTFTYHQHREDNKSETDCQGLLNCSHLPIININTNNQQIPGLSKLSNEYLITTIDIYDGGNNKTVLGENGISKNIRLKYRGRSSLYFDKKGYLIKFINENNQKENVSFLGMPKESDWVLHGPFIDKTLIRNYMWYNIGQEIMGEAPKNRFVELYVDNQYQGLYLAIEAVTRNDESRVIMSKKDKKSIATSYLLQVDVDIVNEVTKLNSFSIYTNKLESKPDKKIDIEIVYPDEEELTSDVKKYISDDFSKFEKTIYSYDYKEYEKYIDVDNFIDYFIINEFTQNYDVGYTSTYIYKDIAGKLKMYIWDFNSANNNYEQDLLKENQTFKLQETIWYEMLMKDPKFVEKVIKRYKELRKTYLSEEYLYKYIDETVEYLGPAVDRNFSIWSYDASAYSFVPHFIPTNHNEAIEQLKSAIKERGTWMDKNIETLKQYCHESSNKKYNK